MNGTSFIIEARLAERAIIQASSAAKKALEKIATAIEEANEAVENSTPDPDAEIDPATGNIIVKSTIPSVTLTQVPDENGVTSRVTAVPTQQEVEVELETQGQSPTEAPLIAGEEETPSDSGAPTKAIGPMIRAAKSGTRGLG